MDPRDRESYLDRLGRPGASEGHGPLLGRVIDLGHKPADTDTGRRVYAFAPLAIEFEEKEGADITFTPAPPGSGTIYAANVATIEEAKNPEVDENYILFPTGDRYVFAKGSPKTYKYLVVGSGTGFDVDAGDGSRFRVKVYIPLDAEGEVNWQPTILHPARLDEERVFAEGNCRDVTADYPPLPHDSFLPTIGRLNTYYRVWGEFDIPAPPVRPAFIILSIEDTKGDYPYILWDNFTLPSSFDPDGIREATYSINNFGTRIQSSTDWRCPRFTGPIFPVIGSEIDEEDRKLPVITWPWTRTTAAGSHSFGGIVGAVVTAHVNCGIVQGPLFNLTRVDGTVITNLAEVERTVEDPDVGLVWLPVPLFGIWGHATVSTGLFAYDVDPGEDGYNPPTQTIVPGPFGATIPTQAIFCKGPEDWSRTSPVDGTYLCGPMQLRLTIYHTALPITPGPAPVDLFHAGFGDYAGMDITLDYFEDFLLHIGAAPSGYIKHYFSDCAANMHLSSSFRPASSEWMAGFDPQLSQADPSRPYNVDPGVPFAPNPLSAGILWYFADHECGHEFHVGNQAQSPLLFFDSPPCLGDGLPPSSGRLIYFNTTFTIAYEAGTWSW